MYAAGVRGAGSVCDSGMGDRMFYHTPPLRSAMTAVTGRCYVRTDRAPRRAGSPKPYNCRRTFRTAHDPTFSFRIVRRNPDGGFLCAGAAQSLVRPGLRRGLHPRLHLRLSPGSVALRAGRGGMVADRCAPLVVAAPCPGGPHPLRPGLPVRLSARAAFKPGAPLKPAFGLSGNVQILLVRRGFGMLLPWRLSATAARIRSFRAASLILSPSWMSMARLTFPSRLELNRREGSGNAAPLANVILTTFLYVSPVHTIPPWENTGVPGDVALAHFNSSTISGSAWCMSSRTFASVFPRQSPSSLIFLSMNAAAEGAGFFVYRSNSRKQAGCAQRNLQPRPVDACSGSIAVRKMRASCIGMFGMNIVGGPLVQI